MQVSSKFAMSGDITELHCIIGDSLFLCLIALVKMKPFAITSGLGSHLNSTLCNSQNVFSNAFSQGLEVTEEGIGLPTYYDQQYRNFLLCLNAVRRDEHLYPLQVCWLCCTACAAACLLRQVHNYSTRLLMALALDIPCTLAILNTPIGCCNLESCLCGQSVCISIINQHLNSSCAKARYFVYY